MAQNPQEYFTSECLLHIMFESWDRVPTKPRMKCESDQPSSQTSTPKACAASANPIASRDRAK
jgi:hypothetical protein